MPSWLWPEAPCLFTAPSLGAALERLIKTGGEVPGQKERKREPRCEAWSYGHFSCFGTARYVVRATRPRETEPPTLCWRHAQVQVRTEAVPQGVLYRRAPDGHGWVVVPGSTGESSPPAGDKAPRHARHR